MSPGTARPGFEAVDHRQQVAEQALVGELARHVDVARQPLALVLEVGALAQRVLAQPGQFGLGGLELGGHGEIDVVVDGLVGRVLHRFGRRRHARLGPCATVRIRAAMGPGDRAVSSRGRVERPAEDIRA